MLPARYDDDDDSSVPFAYHATVFLFIDLFLVYLFVSVSSFLAIRS